MKILFVHNFYGSSAPSGENSVYKSEVALLRKNGHEVLEYTRSSDEIRKQGVWGLIKGGFATPWNYFSYREVKQLILAENPDVMHVHNTFPLISPAIFWAAAKTRTATVFTLHNYRIYCGEASLSRGGKPCHKCLDGRSVFMSLLHRCYRQGFLATIPMAIKIASHRMLNTWNNHIDSLITLSSFQAELMEKAGIKKELITIKPNFLPDAANPVTWNFRENKIVFVGRLSQQKGVHLLVKAWELWGESAPKLELIGDGPDRYTLENMVKKVNLTNKIHFSGHIANSDALNRLAKVKMMILPSICYEGFPLVICEAFAMGVPVAASDHGAMGSMITDGVNGKLFLADNAKMLLSVVQSVWGDDKLLSAMAENARSQFERQYTSKVNYAKLMDIYNSACEKRKKKLLTP
ncbi:MAG: glycosyltransferase family 4 protein [Magnetococcales bacterium]|nr:glycosyltransferase family 4 protein [Magnetococcales bacterium]